MNRPLKLIIFDLDGTLVDVGGFKRVHEKKEKLYNGCLEMLETLSKKKEILLAIATGKSLRGTKKLLSDYDISHYFTSLQTPDNSHAKPNPNMIINAMNKVGLDKKDVLMIGDTTLDMKMAKAAGVKAIAVSWGFQPIEILKEAGASLAINDYNELVLAIGEFTNA